MANGIEQLILVCSERESDVRESDNPDKDVGTLVQRLFKSRISLGRHYSESRVGRWGRAASRRDSRLASSAISTASPEHAEMH